MAKKPQYRLETLFEIREKEKEAAEEEYASRMAVVAKERQTHDEIWMESVSA